MYQKILKKCSEIAKNRGKKYGNSAKNFAEISRILAAVFDLNLSEKEICAVFLAAKLAREKFAHDEDNLFDAVNYLAMFTDFSNLKWKFQK